LTISKADLSALMNEKAKSGPYPLNELMDTSIPAEFYQENKVYSGEILIDQFPDPFSSYPVINFRGTGALNERVKQ
jgi:hypothetical protein